ncbi:MAG: hypothetical protein ACE5I3_09745 [Phycisphaerae bacterium]
MGIFAVDIEIARITDTPKYVLAPDVTVDSGSEMTWIADETLRAVGIEPWKKDQPFVMANGQHVTRQVGYAMIRCGDFKTVDEVVFAQPGDLQLLGARTLEGFNAIVDSRRRQLVAAGPMPAAGASASSDSCRGDEPIATAERDRHSGARCAPGERGSICRRGSST